MTGPTMPLRAVTLGLEFAADACQRADLDGVDLTDAEEALRASEVVTYEAHRFADRIRAACERAVNNTPVPHPVKPLPKPPPPPDPAPKDAAGASSGAPEPPRNASSSGGPDGPPARPEPTPPQVRNFAHLGGEPVDMFGELRLLRSIVRSATYHYEGLPPSARRAIAWRAGNDESLRLINDFAGYSPLIRSRIEGALAAALQRLGEDEVRTLEEWFAAPDAPMGDR